MPARLDFYEEWLSPDGLRDGSIGLAPVSAVIGFLRTEGEQYHEWWRGPARWPRPGALRPCRRSNGGWAASLPLSLRSYFALRMLRRIVRDELSMSSVGRPASQRGHATFRVQSSVFCTVRATACAAALRLLRRARRRDAAVLSCGRRGPNRRLPGGLRSGMRGDDRYSGRIDGNGAGQGRLIGVLPHSALTSVASSRSSRSLPVSWFCLRPSPPNPLPQESSSCRFPCRRRRRRRARPDRPVWLGEAAASLLADSLSASGDPRAAARGPRGSFRPPAGADVVRAHARDDDSHRRADRRVGSRVRRSPCSARVSRCAPTPFASIRGATARRDGNGARQRDVRAVRPRGDADRQTHGPRDDSDAGASAADAARRRSRTTSRVDGRDAGGAAAVPRERDVAGAA